MKQGTGTSFEDTPIWTTVPALAMTGLLVIVRIVVMTVVKTENQMDFDNDDNNGGIDERT